MQKEKEVVANLLSKAGIELNGPNPWDIQVHNENFYARVLREPHLALGESYMDGWWDCEKLDEFFFRILRNNLEKEVKDWRMAMHYVKAVLFNYQTKSKSPKVAQQHYDAGNDLYVHMLGKSMAYTCAYWRDAKNLDEAEFAKFDLVCKKVGLKPGMKILDLGCGFGSFMKFAAEKYGVSAVGYNLSKEQVKFGQESCKGLPVEFKLADYREATGKFDRVISIGLMEHVGYKNYKTFFEVINRCLVDDGLALVHTIGSNKSTTVTDAWISKYIFPNGMLPSIKQIGGAIERRFIVEDLHNFGANYDLTLMAWFHNFKETWPQIKAEGKGAYDERFYRMWSYYLLSCAGMFRARSGQLWQFVLSKKGVIGGYTSVR